MTSPSSSSITAVIWDLGGVFSASPFRALETFAAEKSIDAELYRRTVFGPFDADTPDHPWHRLERGEMTMADALDEIRANLGAVGIEADPFGWYGSIRPDTYNATPLVEMTKQLHEQGIAQAILTNNVAEFKGKWERLVPIEVFATVIDSHEVGVRKPDPKIYQLALDGLGVEAASAVFVDDLPANVAGAEAVGLHGVIAGPNPQQTSDEVAALVAGVD